MPWWSIILAAIAIVLLVISAVVAFLWFAFSPETFQELFMAKPKIALRRTHARQIAEESHVPEPPKLFCPTCGAPLTWYWHSATLQEYTLETGVRPHKIIVRYRCPNKHYPGAAGNGKVWWTHWGKEYAEWKWAL